MNLQNIYLLLTTGMLPGMGLKLISPNHKVPAHCLWWVTYDTIHLCHTKLHSNIDRPKD